MVSLSLMRPSRIHLFIVLSLRTKPTKCDYVCVCVFGLDEFNPRHIGRWLMAIASPYWILTHSTPPMDSKTQTTGRKAYFVLNFSNIIKLVVIIDLGCTQLATICSTVNINIKVYLFVVVFFNLLAGWLVNSTWVPFYAFAAATATATTLSAGNVTYQCVFCVNSGTCTNFELCYV